MCSSVIKMICLHVLCALTLSYTCESITWCVAVETHARLMRINALYLAPVSHSLGLGAAWIPFLFMCFCAWDWHHMILASTGRHVTFCTDTVSLSQSSSLTLLRTLCMFLACTGGGVTSALLGSRIVWVCMCWVFYVFCVALYTQFSLCLWGI